MDDYRIVCLTAVDVPEENCMDIDRIDFSSLNVTHQVLLFIQLSLGNAPAVQKMSRRSKERAGTGKERLYPLHKSHTTQNGGGKTQRLFLSVPSGLLHSLRVGWFFIAPQISLEVQLEVDFSYGFSHRVLNFGVMSDQRIQQYFRGERVDMGGTMLSEAVNVTMHRNCNMRNIGEGPRNFKLQSARAQEPTPSNVQATLRQHYNFESRREVFSGTNTRIHYSTETTTACYEFTIVIIRLL
ncbi:hypothetical protein TNCV_578271 [Trichonephila clavipes]|nr:hypothetical protein TNCV_578271 [Trichonephila clavipes]